MRRFRNEILVSVVLVVLTLAAFWSVRSCGFVNYDDSDYVTENRHVRAGLTGDGFRWAWTTTHASNWHPLTWLSLQLDVTLFGLNAHAFHLTNLALHLANTLLLFGVFRYMTGAVWRSALVAALFAVHPLHVESVAWIAERKDVLSTLFWMLSLAAYACYVNRPSLVRYLAVAACFALGLMAKPMLVTLPCVLLLLDYWPLRRFAVCGKRRLLLEKLPLFALSAASCFLTLLAQRKAVKPLDSLSMSDRVLNTVVSYASYLGQTVWPRDLCVLYPHPGQTLPVWRAVVAGLVLTLVSAVVLWGGRRCPALSVGWLWYLGTLVPVIGLVQVGEQALADRYTYVALIGIFVMLAWGLPALLDARGVRPGVLAFPALLLILACAVLTGQQVKHWENSEKLWRQALEVDAGNATAHNNLGADLYDRMQMEDALQHITAALDLRGANYPKASVNLGLLLMWQGKLEDSVASYRLALQARPNDAIIYFNQGLALCWLNRFDDAEASFRKAVELQPEMAKYRFNLAYALRSQGQVAAAYDEYQEGSKLDPLWIETIDKFARLLTKQKSGDFGYGAMAVLLAEQACQATDNTRPEYLETLAMACRKAGRLDDAARAATLAAKIRRN